MKAGELHGAGEIGLTWGGTNAAFDLGPDQTAFVRHLVDIGCQPRRPGEWWPDSPRGRYRVLTGPDDDAFCYRVSEALDLGCELHGGPAITTSGETAYVAQAVVWTRDEPPPARPAQPR